MESEGSLSRSQEPSTCPDPGPDQSSACLLIPSSWRSILTLFLHINLDLPSQVFRPKLYNEKLNYFYFLSDMFGPGQRRWGGWDI